MTSANEFSHWKEMAQFQMVSSLDPTPLSPFMTKTTAVRRRGLSVQELKLGFWQTVATSVC